MVYKIRYKTLISGKVDGRGYHAAKWEAGHHFDLLIADSPEKAQASWALAHPVRQVQFVSCTPVTK